LEKIIFVFDGINIPLKAETELIRSNERINSVKNFYKYVISSAKPNGFNKPNMLFPTPLILMTFIQILLDAEKLYDNLEIKFSLLEADAYISELANKYNG